MSSFDEETGLDGSQAILEEMQLGRYHVVDRWSPEGTLYGKLVAFMLNDATTRWRIWP